MNHSIETIHKFLVCINQNEPICPSKVCLKTGMTLGTGIEMRKILSATNFIRIHRKDNRSADMLMTEKGKILLSYLNEIMNDI